MADTERRFDLRGEVAFLRWLRQARQRQTQGPRELWQRRRRRDTHRAGRFSGAPAPPRAGASAAQRDATTGLHRCHGGGEAMHPALQRYIWVKGRDACCDCRLRVTPPMRASADVGEN